MSTPSGTLPSLGSSIVTAAQPPDTLSADAIQTVPTRRGKLEPPPPSPASQAVSSLTFLLNMAQNFEAQGNLPESVKSAETALLVRKAKNSLIEQKIEGHPELVHPPPVPKGRRNAPVPATIAHQARDLVLRCNSFAVSEFTNQRYDAATFFLDKALFLTDNGSDKTPTDLTKSVQKMLAFSAANSNTLETTSIAVAQEVWMSSCFLGSEEERLRLRAATYNNLGCMDRRRRNLDTALDYLRKAIQIEMRLDPTGSASASTYLNLCTVLNEMGKHPEAVVACERAIAALQLTMMEEANAYQLARYAMMLAVAQYNLGVSLERRKTPGDKFAAEKAYQQALDTCHRYELVDPSCNSVEEAFDTIKQMKEPPQWALQQPHEAPQPLPPMPPPQAEHAQTSESEAHQPATEPVPPPPQSQSQSQDLQHQQQQQQPAQSEAREEVPVQKAASMSASAPHTQTPPQMSHSSLHGSPKQPPTPKVSSSPKHSAVSQTANPMKGALPPVVPASAWQQAGPSSGQQHQQPPMPAPPSTTYPGPAPHSPPSSTNNMASSQMAFAPRRTSGEPPLANASSPLAPHTPIVASSHHSLRSGSNNQINSGSNLLRPTRSSPLVPPMLTPIQAAPQGQMASPVHPQIQMIPAIPQRNSINSIPEIPKGSLISHSGQRSNSGPVPAPGQGLGSQVLGQPGASRTSNPRIATFGNSKASDIFRRQSNANNSGSNSSTNVSNPLNRRTFGNSAAAVAVGSNQALINPRASLSLGTSTSQTSRQVAERRRSVARAQKLQDKIRRDNKKREAKELAAADAELADALYEQMVAGMKQAELQRCHYAAADIQRMWRGVMARSWIRTMISATQRLQRVVRVFLVKVREEHRIQEEERQRNRAEQERRELQACRLIQGRVRQFLRRNEIRRHYLARQRRNFMAARSIQRAYRKYCQRRAERIAAEAEEHRREDERQQFRQKVAARRIQGAFRQYKQRRLELAALQEQQRRAAAATKIQAHIRGRLTRAWFAYYRAYARDQELRSAASQRRLVVIQTACRAILSAQYCNQIRTDNLIAERQRRLNRAATRIQCMWRQHVAFIRLERLRAEHDRLVRVVCIIQRWYLTRRQRHLFLEIREANRREAAAIALQRWIRACWERIKEQEFAAYHMEKLREQRLFRIRQESLLVMQACALAKMSDKIVCSMRQDFEKKEAVAKEWQRIARGYVARVEMATEKVVAHKIALQELELATQTVSARILQRAWRCTLAKMKVEQLRREIAAATVISRSYRTYRAKCVLHDLREEKRAKDADKAARRIQLCARGFLKMRKLQEMDTYYRTQHLKKKLRMRREEATIMIQSLWRGYVTRKALEQVKEEHRQRCVHATRLQRMWRRCLLRRNMNVEMDHRVKRRIDHTAAALTIQCFWRKMMAAEYVAKVREQNKVRQAKALVIQTWWRRILAMFELAHLRREAIAADELAARTACKWEKSATLVNSVLRGRQSQIHTRQKLCFSLLSRLNLEEQVRFQLRHGSATKIQALYRGYSERIIVRGLRREKQEQDRLAAAKAEKERVAATRIQCVYRRFRARREVMRRRALRREQALMEEEEYIANANSQQIVRELFWANGAVRDRDATAERLARAEKLEASARTIQRAVRAWRAHATVTSRARQAKRQRAALCIQHQWQRHQAHVADVTLHNQRDAATTIQRMVRGWLVRREWGAWREAMESRRHQRVSLEDVLDHAAIVIQSCWRRVVARRWTDALRQKRDEQKRAQTLDDAASVIQIAYRDSKGVSKTV